MLSLIRAVLFITFFLWTRSGAAQTFPSCASSCYYGLTGTGSAASTNCNTLDIACICRDVDYLDSQICCLHEQCSDADREAAESYARTACKGAGVNLPSGLGCPSLSASGSATATTGHSRSSQTTIADSSFPSSSLDAGDSADGNGQTSTNHSAKTSNHALKTGLGAGLGVGLPVIASLIGTIVYLLRRNKRLQAVPPEKTNVTSQPPPAPYMSTAPGQPQYVQPGLYHGYSQPQPLPQQAELAGFVGHQNGGGFKTTPATMSSPVHELPPGYQQQNELVGSTPPPVHELPINRQHG